MNERIECKEWYLMGIARPGKYAGWSSTRFSRTVQSEAQWK